MRRGEFYIDPDDLKHEILKSKKAKCCTEALGTMLLKLHHKVLRFPRFALYPIPVKEEMMSYSIERFLKRGIYTCNTRKNVFCYFTTGIYNNYLKFLKMYFRQANHKTELINEMFEKLKSEHPTMVS